MTADDLYNSYLQQFLDRGVPAEYAETLALDMAINGGQLSPELWELGRFVTENYLN
jgi:hypothetical protein